MDRLARPVVVPEVVRALTVHRRRTVVVWVVVLVLAVYVVLSPTQVADMAVKASVDGQMVARWVTQVSLENHRHHVNIKAHIRSQDDAHDAPCRRSDLPRG